MVKKTEKPAGKSVGKVIGAAVLGGLVVGAGAGATLHTDGDLAEAQTQAAADALVEYKASVEYTTALADAQAAGVESVDVSSDNEAAVITAIAGVDGATYDATTGLVVISLPEVDESGYLLDELKLGDSLNITLKHNKLSTLFDGKVTFDGEKLDTHEEIILSEDVVVAFSGEYDKELGEDVALALLNRGAVKYLYDFDDMPDWEVVAEDKPLEVVFAGKPIKIVGWDGVELTLLDAESGLVELNSETNGELGGVKLEAVGTGSVLVSKNGDFTSIEEGELGTVDGTDVIVKGIFDSSDNPSAYLQVGEEALKSYKDGDAVTILGEPDDSTAKWVFDFSDGIGMRYDERLDNADEVLLAGQSLSLPNDFATLTFNGLEDVDTVTYGLEFEDEDIDDERTDVLKISASEEDGLLYDDGEETDEVLWDGGNFYVWDNDENDYVEVEDVVLGESGLSLESGEGTLLFDGFELGADLEEEEFTSLELEEEDMSNRDESVRSEFGTVVKLSEDLDDTDNLEVEVPEEKVEASVSVE